MASNEMEQLIQRAGKGDHEAIASLMSLGEQCLKMNETAKAAQAFKEAAMAYRIEAYRNMTHYAAECSTSQWLREILGQIYFRWFAVNRAPAPKQWPEIGEMSDKRLSSILNSPELSHTVATHLQFLVQTIKGMGVEFVSPGGSEIRRIFQLLRAVGGGEDAWAEEILKDPRIRVALETIADCVVSINQSLGTQIEERGQSV